MTLPRATPLAVFLTIAVSLVGVGAATSGCTDGTTPVCDDAGSCLTVQPSSSGGVDAGDDGPAE